MTFKLIGIAHAGPFNMLGNILLLPKELMIPITQVRVNLIFHCLKPNFPRPRNIDILHLYNPFIPSGLAVLTHLIPARAVQVHI